MIHCRRREAGLPDGTYIFSPKNTIWVNFGGPLKRKCWYILWPSFGIFYGHSVHFMPIWYFCGHLVYFPQIRLIAERKIWQPRAEANLIREQNELIKTVDLRLRVSCNPTSRRADSTKPLLHA
jgi:hypothetical protein